MTEDAYPLPRSEGPPSVRNGEGPQAFAAISPEMVVTLDAGAFRAAWEAVEAQARQLWPKRGYLKEPAEAYIRAAEAFRNSHAQRTAKNQETVQKTTKKKIVRRK